MRIYHIKKIGRDESIRDKMQGAELNKQPGWVYIVDELTRAVVGFNLRLLDQIRTESEEKLRMEFLRCMTDGPATMQILFSALGVIRTARVFGAICHSHDCKTAGGPDMRVAFFMGQRRVLHLPALVEHILSDEATSGFFERVRRLPGLFAEKFRATSHVSLSWSLGFKEKTIHGTGPLCRKVFPAEDLQKKLLVEPMALKVWRTPDEKQALSLTATMARGEHKKGHILAWVRRKMQRFGRILDYQVLVVSFMTDLREILHTTCGQPRGRGKIPAALWDSQVLGIVFGFL